MIEDPARREASDPATPLTRLHELAQERPDLRPELAANPSTYPALLEWLAKLGDPRVDAALRARARLGADDASPQPEPDPDARWRPVQHPEDRPTAGAGDEAQPTAEQDGFQTEAATEQFDAGATVQQPRVEPGATVQQPRVEPRATVQPAGADPEVTVQQPDADPEATVQQPGIEPDAVGPAKTTVPPRRRPPVFPPRGSESSSPARPPASGAGTTAGGATPATEAGATAGRAPAAAGRAAAAAAGAGAAGAGAAAADAAAAGAGAAGGGAATGAAGGPADEATAAMPTADVPTSRGEATTTPVTAAVSTPEASTPEAAADLDEQRTEGEQPTEALGSAGSNRLATQAPTEQLASTEAAARADAAPPTEALATAPAASYPPYVPATERLDAVAGGGAPRWQPTAQAGSSQVDQATPAGGVGVVTATSDPTGKRAMWLVLGLVAVLVILGLIWVLTLRGQGEEDPAPVADPQPTATATPSEEPTAAPDETQAPSEEEQRLAQTREAVAALPQSSSCSDPAADATVIADFTTAAAPGGQWQDPEGEGLLVSTMRGLQDSCDAGYAVEVAEVLEADAVASAALADASAWLTLARPAPDGARELDAFLMPSRNISCSVAGDRVTCTILEREFADPPGCGGGPVTIVVGDTGEAAVDCSAEAASASTVLPYGDSATSGPFACTSDQDGVSCWSTITGRGFSVARAGVETY